MNRLFSRSAFLRSARAATLLLASGGSLVFLASASYAQRTVAPRVGKPEISLTAADLGMTEECYQQFQALMAEKEQRTPAQQKIDSELIYFAKMASRQSIARGINTLRIDAQTDIGGRVLVDIKAPVSKELINTIVYNGGTIVDAQPNFNAIRAWIVLDQVEWLANRPDIVTVRKAAVAKTNAGSVTGQGDTTHDAGGASGARAIYNTDGTGVYVGVLSDDNTYGPTSSSTGDIPPQSGPGPTWQDLPGQTGTFNYSEGTAMMEIVHDIAPGASMRFATAFTSDASFAQNILDLKAAGCSVIVDDVYYYNEPPFMDGIIAKSVDTVTANDTLYFSSAGNSGNSTFTTSGNTQGTYSSVWEGNFNSGGSVTGVLANRGVVHKYPNNWLYNITKMDGPIFLFWSDPQGGSTNDYDLYAVNAEGTAITYASTSNQTGTQDPYEAVMGRTTERIYIVRRSGTDRMIHLNGFQPWWGGQFYWTTDGQTHGHATARNAFGVAAAPANRRYEFSNSYAGPYPGTFSNTSAYEYFTSEGPRRVHYLNDGTAITPGNFSSTGGELRLKPDLTAADGVNSSAVFSPSSGFNPFFGTSAAAPHAAAIAALVRSYKSVNATAAANVPAGVTIDGSKFMVDEMRTILINGCIDLNTKGATNGWDKVTGYGILMPKKALAFITAFANPNLIVASADNSTATITWTTALPADTIVEYGTKSGIYSNTISGNSGTSHSVTLTGLTNATGYYYRVRSKTGPTEAESGATFVSPERSFATRGTAVPGNANIIGVAATSTASSAPAVTITLKNAGTGAATNLRITSATLSGISTTTPLPTAGVNVAAGATTSSTLTFSGVTSGTKILSIKGSYAGAYFNFSMRVTVP